MVVSYIRVTSQINCGDVTILNQKRLSLATRAKPAIDNCFGGIEYSGHQIRVRNKIIHSSPWITIFGSLVMRFANDFHSWLRHSWKSLANRLTRDPKIVIHGNSCIILYISNALAMEILQSCTKPGICSWLCCGYIIIKSGGFKGSIDPYSSGLFQCNWGHMKIIELTICKQVHDKLSLQPQVLRPEYSRRIRPMPWLLMS